MKGAVIASAKSSFMAGADIKDMVSAYDRGITAVEASGYSYNINKLLRRLETCGKPVAAAINGVALGGGFELALACHYRVMEDGPKAGVGLPEVKIGLLPGGGGTQRIPRLIGVTEALKLITEGRQLNPQEALKKGLVHEVAPADQIVERARQWILKGGEGVQPWDKKGFRVPGGAGQSTPGAFQTFMAGTAMTAKTTQRNYPAPLAILSCVYEGSQVPIDAGLRIESKYFGQLLSGPVARNLMRTMFVNKGLADKLSRRPAAPPKSQVRRLGMLGAGMMGAGIAHVSALAGIEVVLLDSTLELAEKGKSYSKALLVKDVEKGKRSQADAEAILARIKTTTNYGDLAGCDLIVEAVFENREIKADVTAKTEAVIAEGRRLCQQHLDAADHRAGAGLEAADAVHRHPFLLAGREDAAGRDHRRQEDVRGDDRPRARLRRPAAQDADRRQRQPRLLHQPLLRHVRLRRHRDAAGGRRARR